MSQKFFCYDLFLIEILLYDMSSAPTQQHHFYSIYDILQ